MNLSSKSLAAGLLAGSLLLSSAPVFAAAGVSNASLERCYNTYGRTSDRCANVSTLTRIQLRQSSTNTLARTQIRAQQRTQSGLKPTISNILDRANNNGTARIKAGVEPISRRSLRRSIITTPQLSCSRLQGAARARCLQDAYKKQRTQEGNEP